MLIKTSGPIGQELQAYGTPTAIHSVHKRAVKTTIRMLLRKAMISVPVDN